MSGPSQEDVRALVARPVPPPPKPPLYRSQHPGAVDPRAVPCSALGVKELHTARTMGPPSGEPAIDPHSWLRAHEREPPLPQPCKPPPKQRRKDSVPKRTERPAMGLSSGRDFVETNREEALAAALARRQPQEGEVRYVFKPHFGELPPYLQQRKAQMEAARAAEQAAAASAGEQGSAGGEVLEGEALAELVRHLKLKWQSLNEAYVRLPMVVDTPSKKRRQEELEAQLAEIEGDVRKLQRAHCVRVYAD